jgi:hypothetical protein
LVLADEIEPHREVDEIDLDIVDKRLKRPRFESQGDKYHGHERQY